MPSEKRSEARRINDEELLAECNRLFDFPSDGVLRRSVTVKGRFSAVGTVAGGPHANGYTRLMVSRRHCLAHRIVFLMVHGWMPKYIDHINGNKADNRPENLRAATHSQNHMNIGITKKNKSGFKGVSKHGPSWRARIFVEGLELFLGTYKTEAEASAAYIAAADRYFGEFSSTSILRTELDVRKDIA